MPSWAVPLMRRSSGLTLGLVSPRRAMDAGELQAGCLQSFSKLPVWIIEHIWTHKMMDVQQVVDPSCWPDVDSQPLSLEDAWRLRVVSAQVYTIVRSRDMEHFERVIGFLETTYRLLPRLVAAIKHMKIMFGLKTMVIMWMLKEGRGMVDTVSKIGQFFPSKLPKYQDQCSQHEMFLMRKNHLDFRTLAQTLAVDKDRRDDYIKKELEEQYGERYAQKVEDRLLQYLHELDAVLQGDTYIDKILKKQSPVTEEEKLLLEVITSDPATIATTLKKLLRCDAAYCHQVSISRSPQLLKSGLYGSSSKALLQSAGSQTPPDLQPEVLRGDEEDPQDVSTHSDVQGHRRLEEGDEVNETAEEDVQEAAPTPQFCSKHLRWVKSILRECCDELSEEPLLKTNASSSPLLFQSSSSTSSSHDLTPSDLIPPDRRQTPSPLQAAAQASRPAGSPRSASDTSHSKTPPQALCSTHSALPALQSPPLRQGDICSFGRGRKPHQALPDQVLLAASSRSEMLSSPHSGNLKETLASTNNSSSPRCPTPTRHAGLPRKFRQVCTTNRHQQLFEGFSQNSEQFQVPSAFQMGVPPTASDVSVSGPPTQITLVSTSQSESSSSACAASGIPSSSKSSKKVVPQSSIGRHRHSQKQTRPPSGPTRRSTHSSSASNRSKSSRTQLKLSLQSQAVLLQSKLLQPCVSLTRLSAQECHLWRVTASLGEPAEQGSSSEERREEDEEDTQSSFDVNTLYTTSSSDGGQSPDCDPDYNPHITKKALLLEYERARMLSQCDNT
ncbi:uncharacterized protein LOC115781337 [Archocentrus centrarchus]|uniref:uncharacterized protein LOC115781337 n=1 Tax=Archocentrus centrarchus TaxID=63155 RepID=UPI0011EA2548|nr:uncharacterized protein LOC115781337 [Archocentrus centrarchus]